MGRVRSMRIAGLAASAVNTDVLSEAGAVLHGIIVNVIDINTNVFANGGTLPFEIRAYEDTTGSGVANLIWRTDFAYIGQTIGVTDPATILDAMGSNHIHYSFDDGIWCKDGLRVEIDQLTADNLEVFVLYS